MDTVKPFTDPIAVARYAEDTPRKVPGFADLHHMAMLLLAERAPQMANILVYGAGGGLELRAFAQAQQDWHFVGIDPSEEMLGLARTVLGPMGERVDLRRGYIDEAPPGPFDGVTCLLTLHFLEATERLRVLREIRRRMKLGSTLVIAHHSYPTGSDPTCWLARSIAFADNTPGDRRRISVSAETMALRLPLMSTADEEALLREAGYHDVTLFYAAFSFRGWVGTA